MNVTEILSTGKLDKEELTYLLNTEGKEKLLLFKASEKIRNELLGNKVYLRGLIELSNICQKDCYYCGIRKSNKDSLRYILEDDPIVESVVDAYQKGFGSIAIQAGEIASDAFTKRITTLLKKIHLATNHELGITLSLGEQSKKTYQKWFDAGASRYLLRIESSNSVLYSQIHPKDKLHDYATRIQSIKNLREVGYQVGTGVMVGLPFQTIDHLVQDLLFLRQIDIDMCGMGPYLEHEDTPLYEYRESLMPKEERMELTLKMLACLRLLMPTINIASTTALQAIDPKGRERGIKIAANVIMPNITPGQFRDDYALYQGKPNTQGDSDKKNQIGKLKSIGGSEIVYFMQGNSTHYKNRN